MRERSPLVVLLAILAVFGIRALPSTPPPPAADSGGQPAMAAAKADRRRDADRSATGSEVPEFWQPLIDFHRTRTHKDSNVWHCFPVKPGWKLDFLIASVPDPADSRSGYQFDPLVDAIQRAAETREYVLDRYYYPWPGVSGPKGQAAPGSPPAGYQVTLEAKTWPPLLGIKPEKTDQRRAQEVQPGVLLFRDATASEDRKVGVQPGEDHGRLLMVMLVGETATAGIHKEAFTACLDLIERARCNSPDKATALEEKVLVLGPHYSGSQSSMSSAIRAWRKRDRPGRDYPITIISGSATALEPAEFRLQCRRANDDRPPVSLQATVIPENVVFGALLSYLNLQKESIAVLVESNTGFGQQFMHNKQVKGAFVFSFPLHISDVRAGYGKTSDASKGELPSLPSFGTKLRLPLEQSVEARDTEPSLTPEMTAVTSERQLDSMLATIARERFSYVVITATDVRDAIFLATLVRKYCPNVRLLFTASDMLLSHPDYTSYLKGAVVGSTYPLYPKNQRWSYPYKGDENYLFFTSQVDQGYYNAAIALLNVNSASQDWQYLQEYGFPFGESKRARPPVWISMIGQHGPQPLAVITSDTAILNEGGDDYKACVYPIWVADEAVLGTSLLGLMGSPLGQGPLLAASAIITGRTEAAPQQNSLWLSLFLALSVFIGVVGWGLGYVLWRRAQWGGSERVPESWVGLFWPRRSERGRQAERLYVLVCAIALLVAYVYAAFVYDIPVLLDFRLGNRSYVDIHWWNRIVPVISALTVGYFLVLAVWGSVVLGLVAHVSQKFSSAARRVVSGLVALRTRRAAGPGAANSGPPTGNASTASGRAFSRLSLSGLRPFLERHCLLLLMLGLVLIAAIYLSSHRTRQEPFTAVPDTLFSYETLFFYERATNIAGGISPVVPVVVLGLAFYWYGSRQLKRFYLLDHHAVPSPFPCDAGKDFEKIQELQQKVEGVLQDPRSVVGSVVALACWLVVLFTFCRIANRYVPSVEGIWFDCLLLLALALFVLLLVHGLLQVWEVWKSVRDLLRAVARLRLGRAYRRLPAGLRSTFGPYLFSVRPGRMPNLADRRQQARRVQEAHTKATQWLGPTPSVIGAESEDQLAASARGCLRLLNEFWQTLSLSEGFGDPSPQKLSSEDKDGGGAKAEPAADWDAREPPEVRRWITLAEDFVALEIMSFLSQFFVQLRNFLWLLMVGVLLLLLAVTSYPIQPQRLWLLFAGALIVSVGAVAASIIVQIERDQVVSQFAGTTPNQLNFHGSFLRGLLTFTVPLLAALAATSAPVSDLLHSLLDPILQVLR